MRRHLVSIVIIFGLAVAVLYLLLNTTLVASVVIPHLVKTHLPEISLQSLRIGEQSFRLPDRITLKRVEFHITREGVPYHFSVGQISVYDIANFEANRRHFRVALEGLNVEGGTLRVRDVRARLLLATRQSVLFRVDGIFRASMIDVIRYRLEDVAGRIKGDRNKFQIYEVTASGYGGKGRGQLSFEKRPIPGVILWLEMFAMSPEALTGLNQELFSQIEGKVNGTFRIIKEQDRIDLLAFSLSLAGGGAVRPLLMQEVMPFAADAEKESLIQATMDREGSFPLDRATLHIQNAQKDKLIFMFSLENQEFGLRLKGKKDVQIQKGLMKFLLEK